MIGLTKNDQVIGKTDADFAWGNFCEIYRQHELAAINGHIYTALQPCIDGEYNKFIVVASKFPDYDNEGKTIGVIGRAYQLAEEKPLTLIGVLNQLDSTLSQGYRSIGFQDNPFNLTDREQECLFYLLRGKSAKCIAKALSLSPRTIESHIVTLKDKLSCHTKSELIDKAIANGMIDMIPTNVIKNKHSSEFLME